jgi:hypothetical protein
VTRCNVGTARHCGTSIIGLPVPFHDLSFEGTAPGWGRVARPATCGRCRRAALGSSGPRTTRAVFLAVYRSGRSTRLLALLDRVTDTFVRYASGFISASLYRE